MTSRQVALSALGRVWSGIWGSLSLVKSQMMFGLPFLKLY